MATVPATSIIDTSLAACCACCQGLGLPPPVVPFREIRTRYDATITYVRDVRVHFPYMVWSLETFVLWHTRTRSSQGQGGSYSPVLLPTSYGGLSRISGSIRYALAGSRYHCYRT